jgi:hypothetical protein
MAENCAAEYESLVADRELYLDRARACAAVTLPAVMPPIAHNSTQDLPVPYQGIGARGVNNLASSLLLALLPPNAPFFRLQLTPEAKATIGQDDQVAAEIDTGLSLWEQAVIREIERQGIRSPMFAALRHLLISGNCVLHFRDKGGVRVYDLHNFVIRRDSVGKIQKLIIKEQISLDDLQQLVGDETFQRVMLEHAGHARSRTSAHYQTENMVDMYTKVYRDGDKYKKYQAIGGVIMPETEETYGLELMPYMAPRMIVPKGDDHYGRSYVEEYLGELQSLESLQQSIVSASAASAKTLFLVNPSGTTRAKTIAKAPNLAVREGNASDVSVLQVQKGADLQVAFSSVQKIEQRLSYAFMLVEAGIRNAERVTAEEVRSVQAAIERQLGGVYSLFSLELQMPLIELMIESMKKTRALPELPRKYVDAVIVVGVEALGRQADSARLDQLIASGVQTFGPAFLETLNMQEFVRRKAASLGIEYKGLVKTEEEIAAEQQAAQQAAMQQQAMQAALNVGETAGNAVVEQQLQQAQPEEEQL